MLKHVIIAAAAVGLSTAAASAASATSASAGHWRTRQINQGGGRYTTIVVREYEKPAPYALTGRRETTRTKHVVQRWVGARYMGPVTEYQR